MTKYFILFISVAIIFVSELIQFNVLDISSIYYCFDSLSTEAGLPEVLLLNLIIIFLTSSYCLFFFCFTLPSGTPLLFALHSLPYFFSWVSYLCFPVLPLFLLVSPHSTSSRFWSLTFLFPYLPGYTPKGWIDIQGLFLHTLTASAVTLKRAWMKDTTFTFSVGRQPFPTSPWCIGRS